MILIARRKQENKAETVSILILNAANPKIQ